MTGSAGKTTTKEAVAAVLGARFKVLKSAGNLNNHFGVPLQLLRLEREHEVAVIEMGMNHAGEIAALARIAEPDWGVVSNVAAVHLEHFSDGIEGIGRAKKELIDALPGDGIAILNGDDVRVARFGDGMGERAVLYGVGENARVRAEGIEELGADGLRFTVVADGVRAECELRMLGRHNVHNAVAAVAAGLMSGMSLEECVAAVGTLRATEKRGLVVEWGGARIVNDCYNSNPVALDAMVGALKSMPVAVGGRRIVVAGEMLELGPDGAKLHEGCGSRMEGVDFVVGVRGLAEELVRGAEGVGGGGVVCGVAAGGGGMDGGACAGGGCGFAEGFAGGAVGGGAGEFGVKCGFFC